MKHYKKMQNNIWIRTDSNLCPKIEEELEMKSKQSSNKFNRINLQEDRVCGRSSKRRLPWIPIC